MTVQQFKESFSADAAGTFIRFVQGWRPGPKTALLSLWHEQSGNIIPFFDHTRIIHEIRGPLKTRDVRFADFK